MEKSFPGEKSHTAYPSYTGWPNFLYISLQNVANRLKAKKKVAQLEAPSRAIFSPGKHFTSPNRVNSAKVRQSEHARALLAHTNVR